MYRSGLGLIGAGLLAITTPSFAADRDHDHDDEPRGKFFKHDAKDRRGDQAALAALVKARQHFFGAENVNEKTGKVREDRVIFSWFGVASFAVAARGRVFFLDVREPNELEELGTLDGYVNIPLGQIEKRIKEIPKDKAIITA